MTKEDIIVLCEEAIDAYEDGTKPETKYLLETLYEIRAYLVNEREIK
jgi:hypothetical protein